MGVVAVEVLPSKLDSTEIDGIVYVPLNATGPSVPEAIRSSVSAAAALDDAFDSNLSVLAVPLPAKRLIVSPVGRLTDYHDVRSFGDAARRAMKRAYAAGIQRPLLLLPDNTVFPRADLVMLLGALEALYEPLQVVEIRHHTDHHNKPEFLYVASESGSDLSSLIEEARILEEGRWIARDIGGGDPERMAPPKIQKYINEVFKDVTNIQIEVIEDESIFIKDYPLFAAVNRAASVIERHRGRIMYLRYEPEGSSVEKTLYLVGKGITYDTGGADVKTDGKMLGMSRDKCGAAAVAGFMKVVSRLAPANLRVVGALCLARNSIGENSYVSDEVLTARSGARVRVSNTDAEGRMVMADVLCKLKEEAVTVTDPQLLTIATLTGHAELAVGPYTIAIDNSVARKEGVAQVLQSSGDELGDPFEVSVMRREDFLRHAGRFEGDDVQQSSGEPSSKSTRGHQGPAAFLIMASGLDKNGLKSENPLKYTHLDIAGSAGEPPLEPTGSPVLALYNAFLKQSL